MFDIIDIYFILGSKTWHFGLCACARVRDYIVWRWINQNGQHHQNVNNFFVPPVLSIVDRNGSALELLRNGGDEEEKKKKKSTTTTMKKQNTLQNGGAHVRPENSWNNWLILKRTVDTVSSFLTTVWKVMNAMKCVLLIFFFSSYWFALIKLKCSFESML